MTTGRRIASIVIATTLGLGLTIAPAQAATTKFTSCDQMHKVYKHGIAKNKKAANRAYRNGQYRPPVRPKVYENSYKTLDRDKDNVMCEVSR